MTAISGIGRCRRPLSGALLGLTASRGSPGGSGVLARRVALACSLGAVALWYLTDRPADAAWLPAEGRAWLAERLGREQARAAGQHGTSLRHALLDGVVWRLGLLYFLIIAGLYGQGLWLPQIIKGSSQLSDLTVGLPLSPRPRSPPRSRWSPCRGALRPRPARRHRHVAAPLVAGAVGSRPATAATLG